MSLVSIILAAAIQSQDLSGQSLEPILSDVAPVPGTLIAQKNKSKGKKGKRASQGRKRYLQGEARTSSSKTNIDFDEASIDGERRTPVGVQVGGSKQDHGYDLINLRLRWHPEMIKSTSNLETGKGQ